MQADTDCNLYIQNEGLGVDFSGAIGDLETRLMDLAKDLAIKSSADTDLSYIISFLQHRVDVSDKRHQILTSMLLALKRFSSKILTVVSEGMIPNVNFILPRFEALLKGLKAINIYIIPNGEIEHYYTKSNLNYLDFNDNQKSASFHAERNYILSESDSSILASTYSELMTFLGESVPQIKVDLSKHLKYQIIEWLQKVQNAISKEEVKNLDSLKQNARIDYNLLSQIIEIIDLKIESDKKFKCKIKMLSSVSSAEKEIDFDERTIAHEFEFSL